MKKNYKVKSVRPTGSLSILGGERMSYISSQTYYLRSPQRLIEERDKVLEDFIKDNNIY